MKPELITEVLATSWNKIVLWGIPQAAVKIKTPLNQVLREAYIPHRDSGLRKLNEERWETSNSSPLFAPFIFDLFIIGRDMQDMRRIVRKVDKRRDKLKRVEQLQCLEKRDFQVKNMKHYANIVSI